MEIWKDVINYNGIYQVSNYGNVKSQTRKDSIGRNIKGKVLNKILSNRGYYVVNLSRDGVVKKRTVHQLMAESFLNHKPNGYLSVINHINLNKLDNNIDNLEIITPRENSNKKHIKSSSKYVGVTWHKQHKKWYSQIYINGKQKFLGLFDDEIKASDAYNKRLLKITQE
jgi:hypothetical protein